MGNEIISFFKTIITEIIIMPIAFIAGTIFNNRKKIKVLMQGYKRYNKEIHIMCAYLFRVKYQDKYILIKEQNEKKYHPIGGVYKYYDSFKNIKENLEIRDEISKTSTEENDLKISLKGKYLSQFLDWFATGKNREVLIIRNFFKDLGSSFDFSMKLLKKSRIEFIKQIKKPIEFSNKYKGDEIIIFDIFELELPPEMLKEIIKRKEIILVSDEDIEKGEYVINNQRQIISKKSEYIL